MACSAGAQGRLNVTVTTHIVQGKHTEHAHVSMCSAKSQQLYPSHILEDQPYHNISILMDSSGM